MQRYSTLGDTELVTFLQSDDKSAFTEIYNRYWEKLLAIGFYHTRDKQAAEDIVHDVMLGLWTRRSVIQVQSLHAYLVTAVKFSVFKAIARDKRRREILAGKRMSQNISEVEEKLDAKILQECYNGALASLPEKTRLVFTYSRDAEFSVSEISVKLDLSPKAIEYHITKAMRALKSTIGKLKSFFI